MSGDSLWSLSKQYLGCGSKWKQVTYKDGTYPEEMDLTIGRTLVFSSSTTIPTKSVVDTQRAVTTAVRVQLPKFVAAPSPKPTEVLSFNTSVYCCAQQKVVMGENGQFQIVDETHPFYVQEAPDAERQMAKFMNIRISEELLDAFSDQ